MKWVRTNANMRDRASQRRVVVCTRTPCSPRFHSAALLAAGLGKTLMTISLLCYLKQYRNYHGPHLVIVPKSTSSNWYREINRWSNNLSCFKFHGNQEERDQQKPMVATHDVTITTYEMVIRENDRSEGELSKRVEYLLKLLEKEQESWTDLAKEAEKKRRNKVL